MKTATFSEFRNNAKKFFDEVERGETVEIYRHGKPIAIVSPAVREEGPSRWKTAQPIALPGPSVGRMILDDRKKDRS